MSGGERFGDFESPPMITFGHIGNPHWTEEEIFLAIEAISAIYLGGYTERNGRFKTYEGTFHDLGLKGGRLEDAFMDQMRLYGVEPAEAKNYRTAKAIMKKVKDAEKVLLGVADPQDEKTSKTAAAAARRWPIRLQFLINQKKRMSRIVSTTSKNQKVRGAKATERKKRHAEGVEKNLETQKQKRFAASPQGQAQALMGTLQKSHSEKMDCRWAKMQENAEKKEKVSFILFYFILFYFILFFYR